MEEKGFLLDTTAYCVDRIGVVAAFQGRILKKQNLMISFALFRRKAGH